MIFVISANPLFREIIRECMAPSNQCLELEPEQALGYLREIQPEKIIIDESIDLECIDRLMRAACQLSKARILLVSPQKEEMILIDSRKTTLKKIEDLMGAF